MTCQPVLINTDTIILFYSPNLSLSKKFSNVTAVYIHLY